MNEYIYLAKNCIVTASASRSIVVTTVCRPIYCKTVYLFKQFLAKFLFGPTFTNAEFILVFGQAEVC